MSNLRQEEELTPSFNSFLYWREPILPLPQVSQDDGITSPHSSDSHSVEEPQDSDDSSDFLYLKYLADPEGFVAERQLPEGNKSWKLISKVKWPLTEGCRQRDWAVEDGIL